MAKEDIMKQMPILKEAQVKENLYTVQKSAKVRTITFDDIQQKLDEVMERILACSTFTNAIGTKVKVDLNAQHFPSAYKYTPESTVFCAELKRNGWSITSIRRERCHNGYQRVWIDFTQQTIDHMAEIMGSMC